MLKIEICYAPRAHACCLLSFEVALGTTVQEAIQQSNLLPMFPELSLATLKVGIYSRRVQLAEPLQQGDRIEIYRPLTIDPKQARLLRARKK